MEAKLRDSEEARMEMKNVVEEFEKTMSKMIGMPSEAEQVHHCF